MYKAELWEDWDDGSHFTFDLQYLFDNYRDIYKKVATNISHRAYNHYPEIIFNTILDRFLVSPTDLSSTIVTNVSKK